LLRLVSFFCRFHEPGRYSVDVFINNKPYGERQFVQVIRPDRGAILLSDIEQAFVGNPSKLIMRVKPDAGKNLTVIVIDADRRQVPVALQKLPDEIVEAEFIPRSEGVHNISVLVGDEHVQGSPFKITVLDLSAVRVIGLKNDRVGAEQRFNGKRSSLILHCL
uniref:Cadherin domain-containing protein n=1 Tax=Gongylonema pulchrum TaxID=637853 RepID=A0A183DII7_9BILA